MAAPGLWFAETYLNFSSETAEQNSAKLDRKQDLSALYQVCVFWAEKWIKMATLANPSIYILIYNPFQNFSRVHCTQVSDSGPLGLLFVCAGRPRYKWYQRKHYNHHTMHCWGHIVTLPLFAQSLCHTLTLWLNHCMYLGQVMMFGFVCCSLNKSHDIRRYFEL